jgi:hypothetical protein
VPDEKLNIKFQIRLSKEHKENLDSDLPLLVEQIKKQTGIVINRSDFLRLCLEDLHRKILLKEPIVWPPQLETSAKRSNGVKQPQSKSR